MHNATVDFARLIAAFGIVLFHSHAPGAAIGYAGLPFFLILLAPFGLSQRTPDPSSLSRHARARAERLLLPWVGWSLIYGGVKLAEVFLARKPLSSEFAFWMLATGPALHLWFLPFAFLASIVTWFIAALSRKTGLQSFAVPVAIAATGAAALLVYGLPYQSYPPPLTQYIFALPSFFLGIAFAFQRNTRWSVLCMALLSLAIWRMGFPGGGLQLLIAGWVVLLCFSVFSPATRLSARAASLSLSVYLLHPLVLAISARAFPLPAKGLEIALVTIVLTTLMSVALHRVAGHLPQTSLWRRLSGF